jgi:chemotaxis protein CheD
MEAMTSKPKTQAFNPAVLPMEYLPRIPYASDEKHTRHYLIPGKLFAAAQPFAITTILGSGVALCLWDSALCIGGANHIMLADGPIEGDKSTRYANVAHPALLQRLIDIGADIKTIEAKVFGGSLPNCSFGNDKSHMGDLNVQATLQFLKAQGIRVAQSEIGGTRGRKLVFHTDDGRAWSEQL